MTRRPLYLHTIVDYKDMSLDVLYKYIHGKRPSRNGHDAPHGWDMGNTAKVSIMDIQEKGLDVTDTFDTEEKEAIAKSLKRGTTSGHAPVRVTVPAHLEGGAGENGK